MKIKQTLRTIHVNKRSAQKLHFLEAIKAKEYKCKLDD